MGGRNDFQQAVIDLNCEILGFKKPDGSSDEGTLRAQGGGRHIAFLKGKSSTLPGSNSAPTEHCKEGDERGEVQLHVAGYGYTEGDNLAEAVSKMKARISGSDAPAAAASGRGARRA